MIPLSSTNWSAGLGWVFSMLPSEVYLDNNDINYPP